MVGAAGGTVTGPAGAQVVIPAGALAGDTTIDIAQSSAGAPALPGGFAVFGQTFAFTPHGTSFAVPVTITVPFDPSLVPAGGTPVLYKTNAQNQWEPVANATVNAGNVTAQISSFSWVILGNRRPAIAQQPQNAAVVEPATATFFVTADGTQPLTYQWQLSGNGGLSFVDIPNNATAASYTTGATSVANDHNDLYRVTVGSPEGATVSNVAILTVTDGSPPPASTAGVTDRVSMSSGGVSANGSSGVTSGGDTLDLSENGDTVAFESEATNLQLGTTHGGVFVRRISTGATRLVSPGLQGATPNGITGESVAISGDRLWVAFVSRANNLVAGDTSDNQSGKVFIADSCVPDPTGPPIACADIEIASVTSANVQPNAGGSDGPDLNFDGSRVVFSSNSNLLTGFGTLSGQIWLRDRSPGTTGTTELISVDANGSPGAGFSHHPRISRNGRFVVFVSGASNLVADDLNSRADVFVRDTCFSGPGSCTPTTYRVSVNSAGIEQSGGAFGYNNKSDISDSGRYVVFDSDATNLVPGAPGISVYLHDRQTGDTISLCTGPSDCSHPSMSGDARLVSFQSGNQIQVRDTCIGALVACVPNTFQVSRVTGGPGANDAADFARIAGDGRHVVFTSRATNLVPTGNNGLKHVYRARTFP